MKPVFFRTVVICLLFLCGNSTHALEPVKLQLKWKHQFQFAGYYMAKELGIYESAGLDVTIIEAQPGMSTYDEVVSGRADFGVGTSDLVRYRADGSPIVVLGVIFQHSPTAIAIARPKTPYTIQQLAQLPLMIEPDAAEIWAYFQNEGIDIAQVNTVEHSFGVDDLISGKISGMSVYLTDEPFLMKKKNFDYQLLSPRTAGIDFYGDNFFTTEAYLNQHPEQAEAFYKASIAGWKYALTHIDETIDVIHARYSQRHSREHLHYEANEMLQLIQPDIVEPGYMNKGRWNDIIDTYIQLGMIKHRPDTDIFIHSFRKNTDISEYYRLILIVSLIVMALTALLTRFVWLSWRLRKEVEYRAKIEDELRLSSSKIEAAKVEADKANEFKSRFFASISHDLRTPLTAVIGFSEQALLNIDDHDACEKSLGVVLNNGRYIQEIIEELSDMAQIESGTLQLKPVMLELLPLLHELEAIMRERAQLKNITFNMLLNWPLPSRLYVDATRLKRVLLNLLVNAIKFTENGSVSLEVSASDEHLLCKVIDTGIGIEQEALENLFQPFVQTHQNIKMNYGGTGLGLYITRAFVEKMQGVIGVESRVGQGSCFYFKIPVGIDKPNMLVNDNVMQEQVKKLGVLDDHVRGTVLIAEDVEDNRKLIELMLCSPSLALVFVTDGREAIDALTTQHFDLVLMDIHMPVMTGLEAIAELRGNGIDIPVIALSANMSDEQVSDYLYAGFDGVLAKPIDRHAMFELLAAYLDSEMPVLLESSNLPDVDLESYEKARQKLIGMLPEYVSGLVEAFNSHDYLALKRRAHRYIGSSGMLGMKKLSDLFSALENAADENARDACEQLLQELEKEISLL